MSFTPNKPRQELKTYTAEEILDDVTARFFPRDLIIKKSPEAIRNCLEKALKELDRLVYMNRLYELPIEGNHLDTTKIEINGVECKRPTGVFSTTQLASIFTVYTQVLGQVPFYYNIVRRQDQFIEFLLTQQLQNQLDQKFKNKNTGWMFVPDGRIIINMANYNDAGGNLCVSFFPKIKWDAQTTAWELYSSEYTFLTDYLEGEVMYREGRAMSELGFTDVNTNSETFMSDGTEKKKEEVERFIGTSIFRTGRRM